MTARPDPQRRRLTVSHAEPVATGKRVSADRDKPGDKLQRLEKSGLNTIFDRERLGGSRAISITSVTDDDLKRRQSFGAKDEELLSPVGADDEELVAWLKTLGIGWACRKGLKPEAPNQDSFSVLVVENEFALYCVYDGHGPCGHDVSNIARESVVKYFLRNANRSTNPGKAFEESFSECQQMLEESKGIDPAMSGTTCTMAYHDFKKDFLTVAHVGDSRSVLGKRKDSKARPEAEDLTIDHKPNLEKERKRIESSDPPGRVIFDGFYNHRVFALNGMYPGLNMSRALGDVLGHKEAGLSAVPDIKEIDLAALRKDFEGISLLLCTDGVWEFIDSKEALQMVSEFDRSHTEEAMKRLAEESWDRWMQDSEHEISDDITCILIHLT